MKAITKKGIAGFMAVVMMTGVALTGQPEVKVEAKTKISKAKAVICTGEKLQLKVSGTKKTVKWKSSKKATAVVDKNGVVTGKKKGACVIKGRVDGKDYSCKLTVKALPKNYATVNGTKVKVGGKVKITYIVASDTPVSAVNVRYIYFEDQLKVVSSEDDKGRFKTWVLNDGFENLYPDKQPRIDRWQGWGFDEENPTDANPIPCKEGKEFDSFYVKALKSGNFTFKSEFSLGGANGEIIKKFTIIEKVK